jgi:hypothetical protein
MHILGHLEEDASLGNRHGGFIYPIIQYINTMNINIVDHKFIRWKREKESPIDRKAPIGDPNKKGSTGEEVYKI